MAIFNSYVKLPEGTWFVSWKIPMGCTPSGRGEAADALHQIPGLPCNRPTVWAILRGYQIEPPNGKVNPPRTETSWNIYWDQKMVKLTRKVIHPSTHPSIHLSIYHSIHLSISTYLDLYLSILFLSPYKQTLKYLGPTFPARGLGTWALGLWSAKARAEVFSADRLGFLAAEGDLDAAAGSWVRPQWGCESWGGCSSWIWPFVEFLLHFHGMHLIIFVYQDIY